MQNPRLSWIPLHGAIESFLRVSNLLYHLFTNCDWIFRLIRRFYWSKISNWWKRPLNVEHRQVHKNISQRSLAGQSNHCTLNCDMPYKYPILVHLASYQNETELRFFTCVICTMGNKRNCHYRNSCGNHVGRCGLLAAKSKHRSGNYLAQ